MFLLRNIVHFTRLLGELGLDVQAARTLDVVHALEYVDLGRRSDFYHTLRCLLVHRPQDLPVFDRAFHVFWRRPPGDWTTQNLSALGQQRRSGAPQVAPPVPSSEGDTGPDLARTVEVDRVAALSYSAREVLRTKDFAHFTNHEIAQAKQMLAELRWNPGVRRTHRWRAGPGRMVDLRKVIRASVTHGGELVDLPRRERKQRRRPLVLLCDVSGSMERYTLMLLHFVYCVVGRLDRVEAFVFATRLTRITRHLQRRVVDAVVTRIPGHVPDFSGGTRIGEALADFNRRWSHRVLGHSSVVLVISDGWDRGDPALLAAEIARLQRTAHRLVWLNPLLGSPDYAPLTRGMQAALPCIDDFLPVHNLASLETLAEHLNTLPTRRPARRRRPREPKRRVLRDSSQERA